MIVKNVIIANMEMKISVKHHAHSHIFHNPEGLSGYGGFGEFVVAKADDLFVYAKDTPFEKMAFTEPVACVINSINRTDIKLEMML